MSFDSPELFVLSFAFLTAFAAMPFLRGAATPPAPAENRSLTLDGLRGVLALSVFFHHAIVYHHYLQDGRWTAPSSHLFSVLGPLAVCMFFMVTGYLFFGQLLRARGRPDWYRLYIGRVFRIGPLYVVATATMLVLVFASQGFTLHEPVARIGFQCLSWIGLGMSPWMSVNGEGFPDFWLAGVTWSIRYEWLFYICLPVLALLSRRPRWALWLVTIVLGLLLSRHAARAAVNGERPGSVLVCLFLVGMLCASARGCLTHLRLVQHWSSCISIGLIVLAFAAREPYTWLPVVCLGGVFFLVCEGCTLFGLLTLPAVRRMGDISYGIYLLQGLALALCLLPSPLKHLALSSVGYFWLLICLSGMILLLAATFAHVYIERPAISAGRALASRGRPSVFSAVQFWRGAGA